MLNQTIKGFSLFASVIFAILAMGNYFSSSDIYGALIAVSFIIHLLGCVADYVWNWQIDRRRFDYGIDKREYDRLMKRETD